MSGIDTLTAALLWPAAACSAIAVVGRLARAPVVAGVALAVAILWATLLAVAIVSGDVGCVIEGFADGWLPVECRP